MRPSSCRSLPSCCADFPSPREGFASLILGLSLLGVVLCAVTRKSPEPGREGKGEGSKKLCHHTKLPNPHRPTQSPKSLLSSQPLESRRRAHESMVLVEPSSFQTDGGSPDPGSVASAGNSRAIPPCGSNEAARKVKPPSCWAALAAWFAALGSAGNNWTIPQITYTTLDDGDDVEHACACVGFFACWLAVH